MKGSWDFGRACTESLDKILVLWTECMHEVLSSNPSATTTTTKKRHQRIHLFSFSTSTHQGEAMPEHSKRVAAYNPETNWLEH
jgi:hypothetical protein